MLPELDKRIPAALLILRFFLAIFLLQWSIIVRLGRCRADPFPCAVGRIPADDQLWPLAAHSYRDRELAAVNRMRPWSDRCRRLGAMGHV
jgi:hypothetical protein